MGVFPGPVMESILVLLETQDVDLSNWSYYCLFYVEYNVFLGVINTVLSSQNMSFAYDGLKRAHTF